MNKLDKFLGYIEDEVFVKALLEKLVHIKIDYMDIYEFDNIFPNLGEVETKDRTGVDFVVLQRSKTVDVRAYLRYVNETEMCPLSKAQNIHIEMSKPDEGDEHILKTVKLSNSCQFVFRNLQKTKYHFRVIEKLNTIEKQIYETTVDLSDERDISNGVKTLLVDIEKSKKNTGDNLNYTIYSPLFLFIMILAILKWDITLIILNDYILYPIQVVLVTLGLQKKRKIY